MRIRKEQLEAFERYMRTSFEKRVAEHLRKFFPQQCAELGEGGVRETVRYGVERAASYGVEAEADVCRYIDLMFEFGRDFDADPKLPWASEILNDESIDYPDERMDRLCQRALEKQRQG